MGTLWACDDKPEKDFRSSYEVERMYGWRGVMLLIAAIERDADKKLALIEFVK